MALSEKVKITRGLSKSQGSVVWPILFLLLTLDLLSIPHDHFQTTVYADDTVITLAANKSVEILLGQLLIKLNNTAPTTNWPSIKVGLKLYKSFSPTPSWN